MDRFQSSQQLVLDYFAVAGGSLLQDAKVWTLSSGTVPATTSGEDTTPTAGKGKPPAGKAPAKGKPGAKETPVPETSTKPVSTLDAATTLTQAMCGKGRAAYSNTIALINEVNKAQAAERERLWQYHITSIANEKEAREAALEAASGAKPKGKGAPPKGGKPPAGKGGKKGESEPVDDKPPGPYPFVPAAALEVVKHEAAKLLNRLEYLHRRCVAECVTVEGFAEALWAGLLKKVAKRALAEGAAVEALFDHVVYAIESNSPLKEALTIEVCWRCTVRCCALQHRCVVVVVVVCLQSDYFIVDGSSVVVEAPEPDAPRVLESSSLTSYHLSPTQLSTLAHALRSASLSSSGSVDLPEDTLRLIPISAFVDVVARLALAGKLSAPWSALPATALFSVAARFCREPGLVDWQAFCVAVSVSSGGTDATVSSSGGVLGKPITSWPTQEEFSAWKGRYANLEGEFSGPMRAAVCETVPLWTEGDVPQPDMLPSLRGKQEYHDNVVQNILAAGYQAITSEDGWHNVTREFPTVADWKASEQAYQANTRAALDNAQQLEVCVCVAVFCVFLLFVDVDCVCVLQDAERVFAQSTASVEAANATLRRTFARAFSDPATSCVNHRRLCGYFSEGDGGVARDVYAQLDEAAPTTDFVPGLDG